MKTQREMVLQYLQEFGEITPLDALREFGIMRLSVIIYNLKWKYFYSILTEYRTSKNRFGKKVTYAVYKLEK